MRAASSYWALPSRWFAARHAVRDSDAWAPALRDASRASTLSQTPGQPQSHSCPQPGYEAALSPFAAASIYRLQGPPQEAAVVLQQTVPGTHYLVGNNINPNSSIKPAELSTPEVPAEGNICSSSRFVLVVCMFCGRVIPFAALVRRMNQRHATCFKHRSELLLRLALIVWSRFCGDTAVDSTSRRPPARPI